MHILCIDYEAHRLVDWLLEESSELTITACANRSTAAVEQSDCGILYTVYKLDRILYVEVIQGYNIVLHQPANMN